MKEREEMIPNIDEMLARQEESGLHQWAKSIEEDSVSMAWRSDLNAKLYASKASKQKKIKQIRWMWGGSLATGLAAVTVLSVLMPGSSAVQHSHSKGANLVSEMVATHQEATTLTDVSGTGAVDRETSLDYVGTFGDEDLL
jgi:hypothetical protein